MNGRYVAFLILIVIFAATLARAQDNYEIQVYGSDLVDPGHTMFELHSNFTIDRSKTIIDGLYPTRHADHETSEITHGFNDWFECGFYIFTSINEGQGWRWVGDHIRPRVAAPKKWRWPVGLSLSNEIGYQRRQYSFDTWTWEIRPIVDEKVGRWYWSLNPTLDRSFHGESVNQGVLFSPNFKFSYDFTPKVVGGLEYYGSVGPVAGFQGGGTVPTWRNHTNMGRMLRQIVVENCGATIVGLFILGASCAGQNDKMIDPAQAASLIGRVLNQAHASGSLVYSGRCENQGQALDFPRLVSPKRKDASPLRMLREMLADNPDMHVTQEPSGNIRMVGSNVPRDLLDLRIPFLSFSSRPDVLRSPTQGIWVILGTPEVMSFKAEHNIGPTLPDVSFFSLPTPLDGPPISGELSNVTVSQALDYLLTIYPGFWSYENCEDGKGHRTVFFSFFPLVSSDVARFP